MKIKMENNVRTKTSRELLLLTIIVFLVNQLPLITNARPVMYDEAWYANTAYNFSIGEGFLNSVVGSGGNANFFLPMLTGIMFRIFGYSLFTIRFTAVLCGVATLFFIHKSMREMKSSIYAEIAVYMFFVSVALYNTIFRFGRPECASIMCLAGGIWLFLRYLRTESLGDIIGLSCFAFLSAIAHPYALLFFAIVGVVLFFRLIKRKRWINLAHLAVLMAAAILAIASISYISVLYNGTWAESVGARFSMSNIHQALPIYLENYFISKHTIYMLPILIVILWCCRNSTESIRLLACIAIAYFIIFPFLFSTDLAMIGLGGDYIALIGTILIATCADLIREGRYRKLIGILFVVYCFGNIGISYFYNYKVKYEKCNTILQEDFQSIIPKDAIVYCPIRQYPMILENRCYSDHYRKELPSSYDYIIMNSQDADKYENSIEIQKILNDYEIISEWNTKQYGIVKLYKNTLDSKSQHDNPF